MYLKQIDELPEGVFENLEELDLSENALKSWDNVLHLRHLPRLRRLTLISCGLRKIYFGGDEEDPCFPELRMLQFSQNLVSDWESVSRLRRIPRLEDVRIRSNPVLETENGETCRYEEVLYIPN